jgi:hypothetical protein
VPYTRVIAADVVMFAGPAMRCVYDREHVVLGYTFVHWRR